MAFILQWDGKMLRRNKELVVAATDEDRSAVMDQT